MDLEKRIRMAAESILDNEALREGLDDDAAAVVVDWGVARAKQIASETAYLEDETEAEEAAYPRMRALRKLLRTVAGLSAENLEPARKAELFQELSEQVSLVYGPATTYLDENTWNNFLTAQDGNAAQVIGHFRSLIEKNINKE